MLYLKKLQKLMSESREILECDDLILEIDVDGWFRMVEMCEDDGRKIIVSLDLEDTQQLYKFLHKWLGSNED